MMIKMIPISVRNRMKRMKWLSKYYKQNKIIKKMLLFMNLADIDVTVIIDLTIFDSYYFLSS